MQSGAAAGNPGHFHEAAFYGSDEELLAIVVPFLAAGIDAGEPTVVTFGERNAALTRRALGDTSGITFVPGADHYARPAATIRSYRAMFSELVAGGATQIRVVGDVPHPGVGSGWEGWARYEAAANHAYDDFPVWGMCPYDTRVTPPDVLDEVARVHTHVATLDGDHHVNDGFEDPTEFMRSRPQPALDPIEHTPPDLVLRNPSAAEAREVSSSIALVAALGDEHAADLALAVSELVTNASVHGREPVRVQMWARSGRVVATVSDAGDGPADPFAGLLPLGSNAGGLGLWIVNQVCTDVVFRRQVDRFTVRITVGDATSHCVS